MLVIINNNPIALIRSSQNNSPVQILVCCGDKECDLLCQLWRTDTPQGSYLRPINKLECLCLLTGSLLLSCGVLLSALRNPLGNSTDLFCFNKLEQFELCTLQFFRRRCHSTGLPFLPCSARLHR